ncbi:MAG: endonuclease VIII [Sandaracinaceae bacterium]
MPEGPEIRRVADRLTKALVGEVAEEVAFGLPRLEAYGAELAGTRVEDVESRGKALLTHFDCGLTVYAHSLLYGRWYVTRRGNLPRTGRQLRFAVHTRERSALLYSASAIEVLARERLPEHPYLAGLGPDVSTGGLDVEVVRARLRDAAFRRRQLAGLYLDQGFLAGLGNYLRAEILFAARLAPTRRPVDLSAAEVRRLADATVTICRRAYAQKGVTLPARTAAALQRRGVPRRGRRHFVYGRAGQACRRCGRTVLRRDLGGRHLYLCPECQDSE